MFFDCLFSKSLTIVDYKISLRTLTKRPNTFFYTDKYYTAYMDGKYKKAENQH